MNYYTAKIDGVRIGVFPDKESEEKFEELSMNYYTAKIDGVQMGVFPDRESAEEFARAHVVPPWAAAFAAAVRRLNRPKSK